MRAILLFPGQGSQSVGMGKALYDRFAEVRELFAQADETLGIPLSRLCLEGPAEELTLTANAQPALLLVSTAIWRVAQRQLAIEPVAAAGHSLGEFSALVAAGALQLGEALRVVRERGRAMQEAVPPGRGSMAAIFGLDLKTVERLCREHGNGAVVSPANLNGAGQIVVAGEKEAVERVVTAARQAGARRSVNLQVSAPFHCSLMAPAAEKLRETLRNVNISVPRFPVISNVTALPYSSDADELRQLLVLQVTEPVRWEECVRRLAEYSCDVVIECGPGKVLTSLAKRIVPEWNCQAAEELNLVSDSGGTQ
ncbi:MAG: malonyl CoA-acyl carrier protein transacylase [Candidatus Binatia bacterium]|nr:MAG: malonyl CoA-acyl carrier protein transacylase [Candidatus Binatia bacterium]